MSTKPQIELFLENENGTQQVAYPFVESDHVSLTNGMDIDTMIRQDVSMPTVTHEDLSFKVGVGDQDVSSAIVDSSVAEMTIKGQTYQNILPEPSTHVLSNNKEMFKVNEGLDPNVEIVDGVSKSAILTGQTLVNLINSDISSKTISINTTGSRVMWELKYIYPLSVGKTYTLIFETENIIGDVTTKINFSYCQGRLSTKEYRIETIENKVITSFVVDSEYENTVNNCLFYFTSITPSVDTSITIKNVVIIEGDYTNQDISYFIGMQSVKLPVLTTTGKNLFDGEWEIGGIDNNGLDNETTSNIRSVNYINVEPNTDYVASSSQLQHASVVVWYAYDKNKNFISLSTTSRFFTTPSNCEFIRVRTFNSDSTNMSLDCVLQIEEGSTATTYEPYKTNILSTPSDLELRGIGEVQDTLDCLRGEMTERIGEVVLDGSENWVRYDGYGVDGYSAFITTIPSLNNLYGDNIASFISADFPTGTWNDYKGAVIDELVWNHDPNRIGIKVKSERASNAEEIKSFLSTNNIRINYKLATPVVKTVDLSSSGNWEKIVFDGSDDEGWVFHALESSGKYSYRTSYIGESSKTSAKGFCDKYKYVENDSRPWGIKENCISILNTNMLHIYNDCKTLAEFKQNLKQNPITLWYQTATHQDSTQVKQPIFFKDGHIQLSSGTDNSLIPTLDYQAKTSNSYVMDLMKTNTLYTMKCSNPLGGYTIDGIVYNFVSNRTFNSPSTFTNKLLVATGSATDLMIIEGDLTSKTIPYFKGIKSAFEDESKIEVLSTGKNIYYNDSKLGNGETYRSNGVIFTKVGTNTITITGTKISDGNSDFRLYKVEDKYPIKKGTYTVSCQGSTNENVRVIIRPANGAYREMRLTETYTFTVTNDDVFSYIIIRDSNPSGTALNETIHLQIEECSQLTSYEPYKSNTTKIPLLSPLRSLPNGVCDELIIDRMKKKATLIQRIKTVTFDGSSDEGWSGYNDGGTRVTQGFYHNVSDSVIDRANVNLYCDTLQPNINAIHSRDGRGVGMHNDGANNRNIRLGLLKNELIPYGFSEPLKSNENVLRKWLQDNPTTVCYELATPVITEVDLEGFPYIYKDGHIFLNGEITPVTEIKYSINQQHQIEASNQDIIRHQKEIDYLYKLIGEYVRVDYKNTLLSLNLELK